MVKSITTLGVMAAALTLAMSAALAAPKDAEKSHSISVEPGAWEWTHETMIYGAPMTNTETQCITPEDATISLDGIAEDLSSQCAMAEVSETKDGYSFKLNCEGDIKGTATGKLSYTKESISLSGNGMASLYGMMAPFSIKADAKYIGACK